jgi:hypothetical protein
MGDWRDRLGDDRERREREEDLRVHNRLVLEENAESIWVSLLAEMDKRVSEFLSDQPDRLLDVTKHGPFSYSMRTTWYPMISLNMTFEKKLHLLRFSYTEVRNAMSLAHDYIPWTKVQLIVGREDHIYIEVSGKPFQNTQALSETLITEVVKERPNTH